MIYEISVTPISISMDPQSAETHSVRGPVIGHLEWILNMMHLDGLQEMNTVLNG